jgi:hypothetical protein
MKRFIKLLARKITFGKHPKWNTIPKADNERNIVLCFHTVWHRNLSRGSRFHEAAIFPVNDSKDSVGLTLYCMINFPFVFEFLY